MNLLKASLYTSISTGVKLLSGVVLSKVVAIYIGPAGLAAVGQLQNFIQIISNVASGALNQGILKYTSEYEDDQVKLSKYWSSGFSFATLLSIACSVFLLLLANWLSLLFFNTTEYSIVFRIFAFTLFFYIANSFLLAILNGKMQIKRLATINIAGSLFSLIVTSLLIVFFQVKGALVAAVTSQTLVIVVTVFYLRKSEWFDVKLFSVGFDKIALKGLLGFSIMAIVSAILIPTAMISIRSHLAEILSWEEAGYWDALTRISNYYLMFVTSALAVYYIPKLSKLTETNDLKQEIRAGFKTILPIVFLCASGIYLSRDLLISILFTSEFIPMREFFTFQLLGDFFRVAALLVANLFWAKAMTKQYIISEIVFVFVFFGLSIALSNLYGIMGVTYAYCLNYIVYCIYVFLLFRKFIF